MSSYGQFTIPELEQKRTEIYSKIDALRAELVAIGRKFERRSQAACILPDLHYPTAKHKRSILARLLGI